MYRFSFDNPFILSYHFYTNEAIDMRSFLLISWHNFVWYVPVCRERMSWTYAVNVCSERMTWTYVVNVCRERMSWTYVVNVFRERVSWTYVMNVCHERMSWTYVVNVWRELMSWTYVMNVCHERMSWTYDVNVCHERVFSEPPGHRLLWHYWSPSHHSVCPVGPPSSRLKLICLVVCFFRYRQPTSWTSVPGTRVLNVSQ